MKMDTDIYGDDSLDALEGDSMDAHSTHYFEKKDAEPCDDYWDDLAE
ncbi:MAG: hypothetical protein WB392_06230 [Methanotrichaceae archaeon]